jgi:hypothetical protein
VTGYAFLVPFIEEEDHFFLKTVIPSRKATRDFIAKESDDVQASDLLDIQAKALAEGMPYQTLIARVLHKYGAGRLAEKEPAAAGLQQRPILRST